MKSDTTKWIILSSILVIISCFLPWWGLFCEYIPISGSSSYIFFLSNPFFDNFVKVIFIGPSTFDLDDGLTNVFNGGQAASIILLIGVIITLIGGALGIISLGNKKIALIGAALVFAGIIIYIIGLLLGELPGMINPTYFTENELSPIFGKHIRTINIFNKASDTFGVSIGLILAAIGGTGLLISGFRSTKSRY